MKKYINPLSAISSLRESMVEQEINEKMYNALSDEQRDNIIRLDLSDKRKLFTKQLKENKEGGKRSRNILLLGGAGPSLGLAVGAIMSGGTVPVAMATGMVVSGASLLAVEKVTRLRSWLYGRTLLSVEEANDDIHQLSKMSYKDYRNTVGRFLSEGTHSRSGTWGFLSLVMGQMTAKDVKSDVFQSVLKDVREKVVKYPASAHNGMIGRTMTAMNAYHDYVIKKESMSMPDLDEESNDERTDERANIAP